MLRLLRFPGIASFLAILLVTAIEVVGLFLWLYSSISFLTLVMSTFSLIIFLMVEHVIAQLEHVRRDLTGREARSIILFSILEGIIWAIWLVLIPVNPVVAFLFFLAGLYVEHQITDNVKKGLPLLRFSGGIVAVGLILFTLSEVIGASLWISYGSAGLLALIIGSTVEHYIATNVGRLEST